MNTYRITTNLGHIFVFQTNHELVLVEGESHYPNILDNYSPEEINEIKIISEHFEFENMNIEEFNIEQVYFPFISF